MTRDANQYISAHQQQEDQEFALYHRASTTHTKDNAPLDDDAAADNLYSSFQSLAGQSLTREHMVMRIAEMGLQRPSRSVLYRKTGNDRGNESEQS